MHFFTNFSFQIYFSAAEKRHKNKIVWQLAKIRLGWISQSNGSIGRPLGFLIDRLNTSASLYRIAPCLRVPDFWSRERWWQGHALQRPLQRLGQITRAQFTLWDWGGAEFNLKAKKVLIFFGYSEQWLDDPSKSGGLKDKASVITCWLDQCHQSHYHKQRSDESYTTGITRSRAFRVRSIAFKLHPTCIEMKCSLPYNTTFHTPRRWHDSEGKRPQKVFFQ